MNLDEPPSLLRNDVTTGGHWLKVKLVGRKSNRSAIGAKVTLHYGSSIQSQEVLSQSSFFSNNDSRLHFGLGDAKTADITVRWPTGQTQHFAAVPEGKLMLIDELAGLSAHPLKAAPTAATNKPTPNA